MPETKKMTYAGAINAALRHALETLPETILYGEDVGEPGGVFGVSKRLRADFGDRVFDTPISETAMLGAGVGAAMMGRRPIVEIMWIDFSLVAVDPIINQAVNTRYVSNGKLTCPMTIRTQMGSLPGSCAQHSQCLEAIYAHVPGLRLGLPATPQDGYSMLLAAIHCDDPVMIIEHRGFYHGLEGEVDLGRTDEPIGGARVRREGSNVTLVTWGMMVHRVMEAADALEQKGISAEVIDLRWLNPLDLDTVKESLAKTNKALVVHEANVTGGFGAEIAARLMDEAFDELDAPVQRLGVPDCRMPAAAQLQAALVPNAETIAEAARRLAHAEI